MAQRTGHAGRSDSEGDGIADQAVIGDVLAVYIAGKVYSSEGVTTNLGANGNVCADRAYSITEGKFGLEGEGDVVQGKAYGNDDGKVASCSDYVCSSAGGVGMGSLRGLARQSVGGGMGLGNMGVDKLRRQWEARARWARSATSARFTAPTSGFRLM